MKRVTLRQLRTFDAVARRLSFSRAAEELHLTQPAVSMQIRQIEQAAGQPLLEHLGKKIFLTEAGRAMLSHARVVLRELEEAQQSLAALQGVNQGTLDITLISTAKYFAPRILAQFCRLYPGIRLKLAVNNREQLLERLFNNEIDLAIMGHPPQGHGIVAEPFARNPHAIIACPSHPLAGRRRLPLKALSQENFLVREPGSGTRMLMERVFRNHGMSVNATMEISSDETIKQAAMAGMGVGFLSLHTVELELQTGRLVTLAVAGMPVMRKWYVVHGKDRRLSPVARAFRDYLLTRAAASLRPADRITASSAKPGRE